MPGCWARAGGGIQGHQPAGELTTKWREWLCPFNTDSGLPLLAHCWSHQKLTRGLGALWTAAPGHSPPVPVRGGDTQSGEHGGRSCDGEGPQVSTGRPSHLYGHRVRGQTMALVTLGFKNRGAGRVKSGSQFPRETRTEQNHGQRLLSLC